MRLVFIHHWNARWFTCCLLRSTWARCLPTSAERLRHTLQGLSITLATASSDAGQVSAVTIPTPMSKNHTHTHTDKKEKSEITSPPIGSGDKRSAVHQDEMFRHVMRWIKKNKSRRSLKYRHPKCSTACLDYIIVILPPHSLPWQPFEAPCRLLYPPDSTVYLRASCATMLTRPSTMVSSAEPRSRRKRDSHARQYCSPHDPRLDQGAWKEPNMWRDIGNTVVILYCSITLLLLR